MHYVPFVEKGSTGRLSFNVNSSAPPRAIFLLYIVGIAVFFLAVIARLFQLSIVKGQYYAGLAEDNRIHEIIIEAPRGKIKDRKGLVLAANSTPDTSGLEDRVSSRRIYYEPDATAHIVGYRQTADAQDLKNDACLNKLRLGDKTGKKGVEQLYECDLRGEHGKKLIEVDAHGAYKKTLSILPPQPGKDIALALDVTLQKQAVTLMKDTKGAVVALKPDTGEVLVLVSTPGFDPQIFEDGNTKEAEQLIKSEEKPLFNRATEGTYPPGSTFKMFVAAAGLEERVITPEETIEDKGTLLAGQQVFHNWYYLEYGRVEGEVDMVKALQRSNDIYFYTLGGKLGPENIKKWAELFGFQNPTNIGLHESVGIIPSSFWKMDVLNERWYLGDTYNLSIGQGYVAATPLQLAVATSAFANGGYRCNPQLLKTDIDQRVCEKVPIATKTYDTIREGMRKACETGGTGYPFFNFGIHEATPSAGTVTPTMVNSQPESTSAATLAPFTRIPVGCKTGTAELRGTKTDPHAWFTVFAPYDKPEIEVTVLVEEGGQGSDIAAPIAKEILQTYFERSE